MVDPVYKILVFQTKVRHEEDTVLVDGKCSDDHQ